jgi:hypothetical protein
VILEIGEKRMRLILLFFAVIHSWFALASDASAQTLPFDLSDQDVDGILQFSESGVSRIEFLASRVPGAIGMGLRLNSSEPFTEGDGHCQIGYVFNPATISQYGISPSSNGEWVVILVPEIQIGRLEDYRESLVGVICIRN